MKPASGSTVPLASSPLGPTARSASNTVAGTTWPGSSASSVPLPGSRGGERPKEKLMPHTVRKQGSKYAIVDKNTGKVKGKSDTKKKAKASARIRDQTANDSAPPRRYRGHPARIAQQARAPPW